jgi:hypothetical protein
MVDSPSRTTTVGNDLDFSKHQVIIWDPILQLLPAQLLAQPVHDDW